MNTTCACRGASASKRIREHIYEYQLARRWYAVPPGTLLPLSDGSTCQLLFAGRPGGAAGPDVQDAILHFSGQAQQSVGDIEFHIRASDWFIHHHHTDARYNNVILHVVLICDDISPILRQDGAIVPMCSLYDLASSLPRTKYLPATWPCHTIIQQMNDEERTRLLQRAGLLRFEQKAHAFVEQLHKTSPHAPFSGYDVCLIPALAEGLGYGRNRTFFRAAGCYLLGLSDEVPEPLGHTFDPPSLDASRLSVFRKLVEQWRSEGAWETLKKAIVLLEDTGCGHDVGAQFIAPSQEDEDAISCVILRNRPILSPGRNELRPYIPHLPPLHTLRTIFADLGIARADILICNIVLPFAMAVALIENDILLAQQAQKLYLEHPGLSSNRITRAMTQQLQLATEPQGACQQQGLHYIYQQTCREKQCELCIAGRRNI